ncbi:TIGR03546 family protein [Rhodopirellula sallentina]|uniref:TIGR03546 family protein n=1 Tax=Rhodopirellula sallentina TaxID=1263869 RepID=UPI0005C7DB25|nr:TIGR03546 family protein [Rhodopirellula sallentina]
MILWTIKLINSLRKAIAGRKHPSQLAWGVAFGVLLGLIPHGNLLAVALVMLVLTLRVNHAMVALVGIAITMVAPRIDPTFDSVGRWLFEYPTIAENLAIAWQYPLMPWTDLNNTVVAGSFAIGLAALVPLFLITYPIFRAWAPLEDELEEGVSLQRIKPREDQSRIHDEEASVARLDAAHVKTTRPHVKPSRPVAPQSPQPSAPTTVQPHTATSGRVYDVRRIDEGTPTDSVTKPAEPATPARETRVAIAASTTPAKKTKGESGTDTSNTPSNTTSPAADPKGSDVDDQQKIDEALSYLLRQLRDSQDKDAA